MQCSFDETIDLPSGGFQRSECINQADILVINDPCCGLCFACAYQKLQAENEKLQTTNGEIAYLYAQENDQLQAENKELKERIEFAVEYLPESPDKALRFLKPVLKGGK